MTLSASLLLASPALADSPATRQWVLATAKATGAGGEAFVSSLRILNPGTMDAHVTLRYLAQSPIDASFSATGDNTNAASSTLTVGAGEMHPVEDVIGTLFGGAAPFGIVAGGLEIVSDQPVSVLSRTYVANAVSASGKPGTYGFSIPSQVESQAVAVGETGYLSYIAASPDRVSGFRCNLILLNTSATRTVVTVALKRADGTTIDQRDYTLGSFSAAQQTDVSASFGYAGPDQSLFVAATVKSGGPLVVGTSIVDNAISSLSYAPPSKVGPGGTGIQDGIYGLVLQNDAYGVSGRLDISGGSPTYLFATLVLGGCSSYVVLQGISSQVSTTPNTTFTKGADGSLSFAGSATGGTTWNGSIRLEPGGVASGTLAYGRGANAPTCPNTSGTFAFQGRYAAPLTW